MAETPLEKSEIYDILTQHGISEETAKEYIKRFEDTTTADAFFKVGADLSEYLGKQALDGDKDSLRAIGELERIGMEMKTPLAQKAKQKSAIF